MRKKVCQIIDRCVECEHYCPGKSNLPDWCELECFDIHPKELPMPCWCPLDDAEEEITR